MDIDDLEALFEQTRAQAELEAREAEAAVKPAPSPAPRPVRTDPPASGSASIASVDPYDAPASATIAIGARTARPTDADEPAVCEAAACNASACRTAGDDHAIVDAGPCPRADADGVCRGCSCGGARQLRDRVGRLTRELHESLQALSLDRALADVASAIPDARNRLKYVTDMCERSAGKVLDTLDELAPLQQSARDDSAELLAAWARMLDERRRPDEGFLVLFERTRAHLAASVQRAERTAALHTDIMMAQDFQDLTGQVCRKIEAITERIETQLLTLLIDTAPEDHRVRHQEMLEGPQVVSGRSDAVGSQGEVDELLGSLGF